MPRTANAGHGLAMAADLFLMLLSLPLSPSSPSSPSPLYSLLAPYALLSLCVPGRRCKRRNAPHLTPSSGCSAGNAWPSATSTISAWRCLATTTCSKYCPMIRPVLSRTLVDTAMCTRRRGGGKEGGRESERESSLGMLAAAGDCRPSIVLTRTRGCVSTLRARDTHTHRCERGRDRPYRGHEFAARPRLRHATEPHQGGYLLPRCPPP
jgi:hypothetical protein